MTKFKAGDKVRISPKTTTAFAYIKRGVEYEVEAVFANDRRGGTADGLTFKGVSALGHHYSADDFELVAATGSGPIDLRSLKVGDKVTVELTVTRDQGSLYGVRTNTGNLLEYGKTYVGTVERAPEPLKVGDKVVVPNPYSSGGSIPAGIIKAIDGDDVWVLTDSGAHATYRVSQLARA